MLQNPSTRKKKLSLSRKTNLKTNTSVNEDDYIKSKLFKSDNINNEDSKLSRRKNFVKACEQVSQSAYINYAERLQLFHLPNCMDSNSCRHQVRQNSSIEVKKTPLNAVETFNIDVTSGVWSEALEVGYLCVTPTQYLSENILKDIVEIMLNAHEDISSAYTVKNLLDQCQLVLALNFSMHPPCFIKEIRTYYNEFLNSPMDLKINTFTNRKEFSCEKGIVEYCINRLENELSADSIDGPLIDKDLHTPAELKEGVRGLNWQKQKFEIFEMLDRPSRIERLMAVMHSISEVFQYDLAIRQSRLTNKLENHIRSYYKLLMENFLWYTNLYNNRVITDVCKKIIKIFAYFIHLDYPEQYIKIMCLWINLMVETYYVSQPKSDSDYPTTGKICDALVTDFYKIISDLPRQSIEKILSRIKPLYIRHLLGLQHARTLLKTQEQSITEIFVNFIDNSKWEDLNKYDEVNISIDITMKQIQPSRILEHLSMLCKNPAPLTNNKKPRYPKFLSDKIDTDAEIDQKHVIYTLYITLHAYLEAYNIKKVKEKFDDLNEALVTLESQEINDSTNKSNLYYVTEIFIKKYRSIYETLQELHMSLDKIRQNGELPNMLKIFENFLNMLY